MKYIQKQMPPASFVEYSQEQGARFDDMKKDVKDELRRSLVCEQGGICCYCGKRIAPDYSSVIEHLLPKGLPEYEHLQLDYSNLLCSCDGGRQSRTGHNKAEKQQYPPTCDSKKNNELIQITPLDIECERMFSYDEDGYIYGESDEATQTIQTLGLDCATLNNLRKAAMEAYDDKILDENEWYHEIEELSQKHNGNYRPFCFAAIYYIKAFKISGH